MDEICERDRKHAGCSDGFVGDGQSRSKVPKKLFMVWNLRSHGERCRKKTENLQNNQTSGWSGTDVKKTKASLARASSKASLARATTKEIINNTARKGRKDSTKLRGTKTNKKHKPVKNTQGAPRVGITLTTGLTQTGVQATGAQICKRQDSCHRHSQLKNSPIQRMEEAFQCYVV